jgi:hypothetical protein
MPSELLFVSSCSSAFIIYTRAGLSQEGTLPEGSEAKPLPAAKADRESLFESRIHLRFFPSRKSNITSTSTFSLRVGFASLS